MTLNELVEKAGVDNINKLGWEIYCAENRLKLTHEEILNIFRNELDKEFQLDLEFAYNQAFRQFWGIYS